MPSREYRFLFEEYADARALQDADADLLERAREATRFSYAPYSQFCVGAAARLTNGQIVTGSNQENASFPAGLCAERVLLAAASSQWPGIPIESLAISYRNIQGQSTHPISPCGICRQSLQEFEQRTGQPIRLILGGLEGKIWVIPQTAFLLPLAFTAGELS